MTESSGCFEAVQAGRIVRALNEFANLDDPLKPRDPGHKYEPGMEVKSRHLVFVRDETRRSQQGYFAEDFAVVDHELVGITLARGFAGATWTVDREKAKRRERWLNDITNPHGGMAKPLRGWLREKHLLGAPSKAVPPDQRAGFESTGPSLPSDGDLT